MEKTDIKQDNYFGTKPEQERMRNVASTIGGIINLINEHIISVLSCYIKFSNLYLAYPKKV